MVPGKKDALMNVKLMGELRTPYQEQFRSRVDSGSLFEYSNLSKLRLMNSSPRLNVQIKSLLLSIF